MILDEIKTQLETVDPNVFYGIVDDARIKELNFVCDYIVFNRVKPSYNANLTSKSDYFDVHIIRENYIPEDMDITVIEAMKKIDGVRLVADGASYNYTRKPNTNAVLEMLTLHFVRARK